MDALIWNNSIFLAYELLSYHPFNTIKHITIGLFFQYFRVEMSESSAWVFLTRSFKETEKCVALLKAAAKTANTNSVISVSGLSNNWCVTYHY